MCKNFEQTVGRKYWNSALWSIEVEQLIRKDPFSLEIPQLLFSFFLITIAMEINFIF